MRSTMAPEMSAAVMIANVPWKHMKSRCGIVPCSERPTPFRKTRDVSPIQLFPGAKASEYPMVAQSTPTNPSEMKLIIIVLSAFLERTSPP